MSDQPALDDNGRQSDAAVVEGPDADRDSAQSTVGTGSVIGLGCLALVVVLVALAIVYRLFGGSW